jgi:predicted ABC-type transport system involved in lysophospholipase L1 biosynthesis ATPase subunit
VFASLNRAGRTIVLVTHDPNVAAHCARVARIEEGKIVAIEEQRPISAGARE